MFQVLSETRDTVFITEKSGSGKFGLAVQAKENLSKLLYEMFVLWCQEQEQLYAQHLQH